MKGTTPSWQRPFRVEIEVDDGFNDINIVDLLFTTGMAQSKTEAKRLIEQNLIWFDNESFAVTPQLTPESILDAVRGTTIFDRIRKVKLEMNKFLLVEKGDIIGIGKNIDDAVSHRIVFK
jgi:choline kinase